MRRIYSAVLVAYNDSAWLAAFTARKVFGFCLPAIKDWHGRHSYLLQATKVNSLAHAKSVTPPAPIFPWSSKSRSEVTTTILKRSIELGSPTARKIQFEGSKRREGVQHRVPRLAFESRGHAARLRDSLNSLIFQTCGGGLLLITLGDHESYKPGFRQQRHSQQVLDCSQHDTIWL